MCDLTEHVAEGILKYSLIPYAQSNGIDIRDLIKSLSEYYNNQDTKITTKITIKRKISQDSTLAGVTSQKRKRGRPKGSNKKKIIEEETNTD